MNGTVERIRISHDRFPAFARHMADEGMEMADMLYMLEKPWKWQVEFNAFLEKNERRPSRDERDD